MELATATLPDGRRVYCVNTYEVDFGVAEIFGEDLGAHGLELGEDCVFFDVGANIGLFALFLQGQCPRAQIFAYEPIPSAHAALEKNLEGCAQARVHRLALGSEPGEVDFDYYPGITALSNCNSEVGDRLAGGLKKILARDNVGAGVQDILDKTGATERVEEAGFVDALFEKQRVRASVDTLSNQIAQHGLAHIDLLKIDTEGAEKQVLAGIAEADWPKIRQLLVEVHIGKREGDLIEQELRERGYTTSSSDHILADGGEPVYQIFARRG